MRLMAIRQARLEPLALSVSGRERMFNGWATASGEKHTRSRAEGDKRIERSKPSQHLASAVEWLAGEAKPPGVKW